MRGDEVGSNAAVSCSSDQWNNSLLHYCKRIYENPTSYM